ncbi:hypothetical protein [Nocardiopsis ansamitocini]|uniref:hypothetical protein n=1 Tax=Nocardiopsis ansamitocini TaxID=1670832 RepID=UPI002552AE98|nr:hypothetical protein [Nocardiopsis ansamitocini]
MKSLASQFFSGFLVGSKNLWIENDENGVGVVAQVLLGVSDACGANGFLEEKVA